MAYENIIYEIKDRLATITLNRPERLNALSRGLLTEYRDALKSAERDDDVRVVIVKGAGRSFCAGYDVGGGGSGGARTAPPTAPSINDQNSLQFMWGSSAVAWTLSKPVIAQVHGHCVAGGNDIAGQCDIVIAAEDAIIQQPQVRRLGLTFNHMFPYKCGPQWAKILLLTGDPISGREAEQLGIVAMAVPAEELDDAVVALAARIALVDSTMLATNKHAVNRVYEAMGLRQATDAANSLDVMAHGAGVMQQFNKTSRTEGLKAALAENEAPFRESERPFRVPGS
jgi:enoyl-CoA hydratase|tara:strand:+ start:1456 stop:2307 length:852 start_codon:yes stop_codon:yes gene_type:complete